MNGVKDLDTGIVNAKKVDKVDEQGKSIAVEESYTGVADIEEVDGMNKSRLGKPDVKKADKVDEPGTNIIEKDL